MKNTEDRDSSQPVRLDRNRAILLSRDLLQMNDFVILSGKESRLSGKNVTGDASRLISFSVIGPGEKILMDVLVRPDGTVNNDLLKKHGSDVAHVFNAMTFEDVHKILNAGFARTRVICWNTARVKESLAQLCRQTGLPELKANWLDMSGEFSAFIGEKLPGKKEYKRQILPNMSDSECDGVAPLSECKFVLSLLQEMAGSSQSTDAVIFNKNWSAAFYRPKLGPAEKLKEILGIGDTHCP